MWGLQRRILVPESVQHRRLQSRIPPLFFISSRHPVQELMLTLPASTRILIPISLRYVFVALVHICTFQTHGLLLWFRNAENDILSKKNTVVCLGKSKVVVSRIFRFCDSLTIPHMARPSPYPALKMEHIPVLPLYFSSCTLPKKCF